jgi:hypothetical protein
MNRWSVPAEAMMLASEWRNVCRPWSTDHFPSLSVARKYLVAMRGRANARVSQILVLQGFAI